MLKKEIFQIIISPYLFLQKTKIAIACELYDKKISTNEFGFTNVSMGIAMVKQGGHAFHCDTTYGYRLALGT